jgi:hypothetical protein
LRRLLLRESVGIRTCVAMEPSMEVRWL